MPVADTPFNDPGPRPVSSGREDGAVLVLVLLVGVLVAAVAMMMLTLTDVEVEAASRYRDGAETFYAADAALEAAIDELSQLGSWNPVLTGSISSRWTGSTVRPDTPLAGPLDLPAFTAALQAETNASAGTGPDTPAWRLFAHGPLSSMWPDAGPAGQIRVAVWIADDGGEADGNPWADSNDIVQLRAEANGRRQSRRIVEAIIGRTSSGGVVRQIAWREVR